MRHSPSLPEIVRVDTASLDSAIAHLISFLEPSGGGFNYLDATMRIRKAYGGLSDIQILTSASESLQRKFGHSFNMDVVKLAAPHAFGRKISVFDIHARKLRYGGDRQASYRVPFFFVEDKIVKAYFLQPRKNTHFSKEQYGMLYSVIRNNLMSTEFYNLSLDIEIVDVAMLLGKDKRSIRTFSSSDLNIWDQGAIDYHFSVITDALSTIERENLVRKVRRPLRDRSLPLFD